MNPSKLRDQFRALLPDAIGELRARAREHAPEASAKREAGYQIRNATGDEAVVRIYDEIWWLGVNAQDLVNDLDAITAPAIRVEINSPGGDVFDGITIYNALRNHPAHITTRVDGLAASIASVIAQAGDKRIMMASGQMMIHNAWGLVIGDHRDHADMADVLKQQDSVIAGIYASRSGVDVERFRELMNADSWLTAEQAVAEGLADEIVEPPAKPAPKDSQRKPLQDQIAEAVSAVSTAIESAEQVSAVRAEAGKSLSNSVTESLSGLSDQWDRLRNLLNPQPSDDAPKWTQDEIAARLARLDSLAPG